MTALPDYLWRFFSDPASWSGPDGIPARLAEHTAYSLLALAAALVVALPLGLWTGHTGRGGPLVTLLANAARALPTYGLLVLLVVWLGIGYLPVLVPLVALAVPPILLNTFEGVRAVDPRLTDAAVGMGMSPAQVLLRVQVPVAMPLILVGARTAAV